MREIVEMAKELVGENKKVHSKKDRNTLICNLYNEGMSIIEIGKIYSISKQRVSQILYKCGISAREIKDVEITTTKIAELEKKVETWKKRASHNRELYMSERVKVLGFENKLKLRDKKINKLEKEIARLTLLMGVENVIIKK